MKRRSAFHVQGFKAPSKSKNWSPGIGRGSNPRPISVPASLNSLNAPKPGQGMGEFLDELPDTEAES